MSFGFSRPAELGRVIATAGERLLPAVADGRVRPLIDSTQSFSTAARAAARLRSHQAHGKIILSVPRPGTHSWSTDPAPSPRTADSRAPRSTQQESALFPMRATYLYEAGDVRVQDAPDPVLEQPTDVLVRVLRSCVCGSDLHPYRTMTAADGPVPMGHEFLGTVEELGSEVSGLERGDLVVAPFAFADNTCAFCREGLHTSCPTADSSPPGPGEPRPRPSASPRPRAPWSDSPRTSTASCCPRC